MNDLCPFVFQTKLLSDTPWKFSHLRYLRLKNFADSGIVETNFFVSFLRAAPFIEKLEIHVSALISNYYYSQTISSLVC